MWNSIVGVQIDGKSTEIFVCCVSAEEMQNHFMLKINGDGVHLFFDNYVLPINCLCPYHGPPHPSLFGSLRGALRGVAEPLRPHQPSRQSIWPDGLDILLTSSNKFVHPITAS